ncbi:hypothetical protein LIT25_21690 [Bacillus sp. F19]|nr:hypothetical protein LIT25_21690 [Bacillus sp. F19]
MIWKQKCRYNKLDEKLTEWHEVMIMQITQEVEILKNEIEQETLKDLPDYLILYRLLLSKYYLFTNQLEKAKQLIFTLGNPLLSIHRFNCPKPRLC